MSLKFAVVASLFGLTLATPVASPEDIVKLFKRGEGVHLVNCGERYSVVLYCANDGNCNFNPGPGDQCLPTNGGVQHWEGGNQKCTFPGTGTTFTWNIRSDAQQLKDYTQVGTGSNGFHGFNIFKDDKHLYIFIRAGLHYPPTIINMFLSPLQFIFALSCATSLQTVAAQESLTPAIITNTFSASPFSLPPSLATIGTSLTPAIITSTFPASSFTLPSSLATIGTSTLASSSRLSTTSSAASTSSGSGTRTTSQTPTGTESAATTSSSSAAGKLDQGVWVGPVLVGLSGLVVYLV
ncbi:hypothetical protein BKA64DRAFT_737701 [Cadophora sp. MPI-SDFR-AT-0126]|nr:hypothetical protein BKA64DRAFT_737701 [Leotiomycetes sp. MPI-SDFR-AT-0126]